MGTRASFWIGNPMDIENREWLGCVAFDGYPGGFGDKIDNVKTEKEFREFVEGESIRRDFASPSGGWPFPWADDVFLTDYTYAFFDDKLNVAVFHSGFMPLEKYGDLDDDDWEKIDELPDNIPAPKKYDKTQPDSIIIVSG